MRKTAAASSLFLAAVLAAETSGTSAFDARRLQTGRFVYRIAQRGEEVARFTLTIRARGDGTYEFTGEAAGFDQRWESVATRSFEPVSATLRIGKPGTIYSMRLAYGNGAVTGIESTSTGGSSSETPIRARVPAGTVDQRIDWAAMLSCALGPGETLQFSVYDPKTGVSPVDASAGAPGRTVVLAGAFDTVDFAYRIRKAAGTENYRIFATRPAPRILIREDFPGGESTELVEFTAEPAAPGAR